MNNSYNAFRNITNFRNTGKSQPISGIELMVDEKNMYFAGNDDGYVMTIDCPYGTQEMANDLLAKAKGFEYQGFTAEQVILPPEAELGDGVSVAGIYGMVARRSFKFTPGMTSNIEAPRELEVQHEYKYSSPQQRKTERQIAETRSTFKKTAEEIMLKVEGIDGKYTEVKTTLDGLTVTDQSGTTKIKGSSIETGSIAANSISADKLNLTGAIAFSDLDANAQNSINTANSNANTAITAASNAQTAANGAVQKVSAWAYPGSTYIDGSKIMTGTVMATKLLGGTVGLLASDESVVGALNLAYTTTGIGLGILTSQGGIQIQSAGNLFMSAGTGGDITIQSGLVQLGSAALCLATASFGTSAPSGAGVAGQLYIQLVS